MSQRLHIEREEWVAWRKLCAELNRLGIDVNTGANGEQLHTLMLEWAKFSAKLDIYR